MANLATADHAAQGNSARGRSPYLVQNTIDIAAAIVLKGSDFAANDTMEVLNVPAGTVVLSAGIEILTQVDGTCTLDMGYTGADPAAIDLYVDGFDVVGGAVGAYSTTPATEAAQIQVIGSGAGTDIISVKFATEGDVTLGNLRFWAIMMDVSDTGADDDIAAEAARDLI
tara:strand:- start:2000 stop:2509 length:510 start_codon:yes stop_codon:yes gene_type:complete